MDDVELPPLPPAARLPVRKTYKSLLSRKRSRLEYEPQPTTSSDPALFSSDEPCPSAENYSAKRRKDKWRGTWWGEKVRGEAARENRQFKRNIDSGVWMGSEGTESSLDEEFLNDQKMMSETPNGLLEERAPTSDDANSMSTSAALDKHKDTGVGEFIATPVARPEVEPDYLINARDVVQKSVDRGHEDIDLSDMKLESLPGDVLQPLKLLTKHSTMPDPPASQEIFSSIEAELRIYLANNSLKKLPSTLFDFSNLRVLSLRNNNLTEISPAILQLTNLQTLNVANNQLEYLPYEILDLIRFAKLRYLVTEPNPWRRSEVSDLLEEGTSITISRSLPYLAGTIHHVDKIAQTSPRIFRQDGTARPLYRGTNLRSQEGDPGRSMVRSLTELALLKCCKVQHLADLPEWLLEDIPPSVLTLLGLAQDSQESGMRSCTMCRREMILPRQEWIEWWATNKPGHSLTSSAIPYLRRQCSLKCTDRSEGSHVAQVTGENA